MFQRKYLEYRIELEAYLQNATAIEAAYYERRMFSAWNPYMRR